MSCFVPDFRVYHAVDMHGFMPRRKHSFLNSSIARKRERYKKELHWNGTRLEKTIKKWHIYDYKHEDYARKLAYEEPQIAMGFEKRQTLKQRQFVCPSDVHITEHLNYDESRKSDRLSGIEQV